MNLSSNIWKHPRTSAAGILIAIVTVAGVLSQQGITLGRAGSGNVVTLLAALAAALLGLMAKDPNATTCGGANCACGANGLGADRLRRG